MVIRGWLKRLLLAGENRRSLEPRKFNWLAVAQQLFHMTAEGAIRANEPDLTDSYHGTIKTLSHSTVSSQRQRAFWNHLGVCAICSLEDIESVLVKV